MLIKNKCLKTVFNIYSFVVHFLILNLQIQVLYMYIISMLLNSINDKHALSASFVDFFFVQNPELLEEWQEGTGGGHVYEAYGQSETVS